jgi:sarcosine oxidase subunit alpha
MSQRFRLPSGGLIDRTRLLTFSFDGKSYSGFAGDTLASALLANGVHLAGRSFKYHRPRGIMGAGVEDSNALVDVGEDPRRDTNTQATRQELYDGLKAKSLNAWPSLSFDVGALASFLHWLLPSGFYYKTFMWPRWEFYEWAIRRAAGLGTAPRDADPDRYEHQHIHADVLVVGGGPAGLAAAYAAAKSGDRVMLVDDNAELGGSLLWENAHVDGQPGYAWAQKIAGELSAMADVTVLTRTLATGYYDHNYITAYERLTDHLSPASRGAGVRGRLWHIRAKRVVLATGALERPLVFPHNDRPGIMLASAVRQYLHRYAVLPGQRAVIAANNDSAYETAFVLHRAGAEIAAIVDVREAPGADVAAQAKALGLNVLTGSVITGTKGRLRVKSVDVARLDGSNKQRLSCDLVAMSGGWNPTVHLFSQSGGKLKYDEAKACFVPGQSVQQQTSVGACAGEFDLQACMTSAWTVSNAPSNGAAAAAHWQTPESLAGRAKQWVDFHNDVTTADVALAARENFVSVEHLKRYTTLGMANDQGKTSNVNGLAVMASLTGRSIADVGTTTFRAPFTPLPFGVIAGAERNEHFQMPRHLPSHDQQVALGAKMEDYGPWLRPAYYPKPGEDEHAAITREVLAVRNGVGITDYSPLGKIEVSGPDALEFLNRMTITNLTTLKVGRTRYNLMLNEFGNIIDDGVITRLTENKFLVGTTSGAAARIALGFEEWLQCEWTTLKVHVTNVTAAWGVILVSGPRSRELFQRVGTDIDVSAAAFLHMSYREGTVAGVPARVHRVSFTGEVSYEIAVPTGFIPDLWDLFMGQGSDFELTPFGLESLMVMRTEKGYIHVGSDTDGTSVPDDVGFGAMVRNKPTDFVGKRSLMRPEMTRPDRLQLVGLKSLQGNVLPVGGHLLSAHIKSVPAATEGHVTSSHWSPTLNQPVALGLLKRGRARMGEQVNVYANGQWLAAEVVAPRFYDPEGERLNA